MQEAKRDMTGESMTYDARIRYWDEEWVSQLLEEALRLKADVHKGHPARKDHSARA